MSLIRIGRVVAMSAALTVIAGGCIAHRSGFEGRVVDLATGQPIEGVVVLAHWRLKFEFLFTEDGGDIQLMETVTDKDGRFEFPSWIRSHSPMRGLIEGSKDPELLIFKPGYQFKAILMFSKDREESLGSMPVYENMEGEDIRPTELDGHTHKLRALSSHSERAKSAADALDVMIHGVIDVRVMRNCQWNRFSKFFKGVGDEYQAFGGSESYPGRTSYLGKRPHILECKQGEAYGWHEESSVANMQ